MNVVLILSVGREHKTVWNPFVGEILLVEQEIWIKPLCL